MILYISIAGLVVACVEGLGQCTQVTDIHMAKLVLGGMVELIFEVAGIMKIYRSRKPPTN